ncbi:hypothetical protein BGZ95_009842 [Linnemannia exigua]|uniref:Uncharacterized protein n=1 Tax=Linnemannia exigua TaxID=604196 RepID=A0AAD4DCT8_9FUNG|nr:hypothetical protein BGZ95_009842 [Linnemannia exigua]
MDILVTSSALPSEDQLAPKSSRPNDGMSLVDTLKTSSDSPYQPNVVRIDVDCSTYPKDLATTRSSDSGVSTQIQASAYINDSDTLSVPTSDTYTAANINKEHKAPGLFNSTSIHSTVHQSETSKQVLITTTTTTTITAPASTPTATILTLQPEAPPSQLKPEAVSAQSSSNAVASSSISILSASGTLVSHEVQGRLSTSTTTHASHPLSRTTTAYTLAVSPTPFDPQQFKATLQRIAALTEQFEALNDQLLDALTSYDESRLGLDFASATGSHLTAEPAPQNESPTDLEIERRMVAHSLVELISSSWSRLASAGSTTVYPTLNLPIQAQPPAQKMVRLNKPQIKAATHLKNTIVAFWSAQSNLHDRAQLVLEILQDPLELEDEGRVRSLRSRHLNNLLSTSLMPTEADRLSNKVNLDQDRMTQITEQLQGVWLEILLVLSNPSITTDKAGGTITNGEEGDNESIGSRLFRIGKSKRGLFSRICSAFQ